MAWIEAGDNRWRADDDDRHVLLRVGGRIVEHQIGFVHVYAGDGDELDDPTNPLGDAGWTATHERPDLADADEAALWQALSEYVKPVP